MNFLKSISNKNKNKSFLKKGFTIVEVIVASTIISLTVFGLMLTAQKGVELSNRALKQTQANVLIEEGVEAVKSIRDNSWTTIETLTLDTDYYLYFDTTTNLWSLNTSSITPNGSMPTYPIDGIFSRTIAVSSVDRDSNDDIANLGILDPKTKKVTVSLSFPTSTQTINKSLVFYLTDIFN